DRLRRGARGAGGPTRSGRRSTHRVTAHTRRAARTVRGCPIRPGTVLVERGLLVGGDLVNRAPRSDRGGDRGLAEVRFLTVAEVAALMRVSKMTVYRLVHSGELAAVRVGRSFRVPEHAVHAYLREAFRESA